MKITPTIVCFARCCAVQMQAALLVWEAEYAGCSETVVRDVRCCNAGPAWGVLGRRETGDTLRESMNVVTTLHMHTPHVLSGMSLLQPHLLAPDHYQCTVHLLPTLPATRPNLQSAQSSRDTAQSQADASKKQVDHLQACFSSYEQHKQELLGQLASAEAGMRGSRVTSSRLLQEGQRLETTVNIGRLFSSMCWALTLGTLDCTHVCTAAACDL
jgi:hypothetical protein